VGIEIIPDLWFSEQEEALSLLSGRERISVISILRPAGEVAGDLPFIVEEAFPPVEGIEKVMGGPGVGHIFIIQDAAEPGALPMKGCFDAEGPCVGDVIAVLFRFGDAGSAAILETEKDAGFPGPEGLGYLDIVFSDIVVGAKEIGFGFKEEGAWFDEVLTGIRGGFEVFEIESGEMAEIVM
jgi:hypothetical protein